MKTLIVYSTWHGHTGDVARHLRDVLAANGAAAELCDIGTRTPAIDGFDAVAVVASVHFGHHTKGIRRFVAQHAAELARVKSAFVSVSGAAASLQGQPEAERYIREFLAATAWTPDLVLSAAGAVLFSKYDPFTRLLMKFTSRVAGRETDTSRDYVYTNWAAVETLARDLLERVAAAATRQECPVDAAVAV